MVKSDASISDFKNAIETVLGGQIFISQTAASSIKKISNENFYLDNYDRQILLLLSKGIKTKNIPMYIPLSISAIDKRKSALKDVLALNSSDDQTLIDEARRRNIVS
jgi:DNA-binding NarL/FixJ family response regulator